MNLVIDIGNTAIKVGEFDHYTLKSRHVFHDTNELNIFLHYKPVKHCLVSSVKGESNLSGLRAEKQYVLQHNLPLPVKNAYATPSTLGMDRLAAVCGAHLLFPGEPCLVIDSGTCITYDFLDTDATYLGGAISPGLRMRYKALNTFTAKLPLVNWEGEADLIGNSTETCIQSGVVNGVVVEMDGIISLYQSKFEGLRVILCGGDTQFFENQLKASIFASPDLVLIGLNSILIYNVNQ